MLARHKAQLCSELSAIVEVARITNGGHQRTGRDRADARNLHQLLAGLALKLLKLDLYIEFANLCVEQLQMRV